MRVTDIRGRGGAMADERHVHRKRPCVAATCHFLLRFCRRCTRLPCLQFLGMLAMPNHMGQHKLHRTCPEPCYHVGEGLLLECLMQVLSLLLQQARLNLHTYPSIPFRLDNWTTKGYQCVLDKTPDRILDIQARHLFGVGNLLSGDMHVFVTDKHQSHQDRAARQQHEHLSSIQQQMM